MHISFCFLTNPRRTSLESASKYALLGSTHPERCPSFPLVYLLQALTLWQQNILSVKSQAMLSGWHTLLPASVIAQNRSQLRVIGKYSEQKWTLHSGVPQVFQLHKGPSVGFHCGNWHACSCWWINKAMSLACVYLLSQGKDMGSKSQKWSPEPCCPGLNYWNFADVTEV